MRIKCANCNNVIEVVGKDDGGSLSCPSCGSHVPRSHELETAAIDPSLVDRPVARRIAHFDLQEKRGTGAFGSVWKARDTKLERTVAIKIPRRGQIESDHEDQFLREAQAAGKLQHPNIVTVFETGVVEGQVYIVSDFIEGTDLKKRLRSARMSNSDAAALIAKVARALHYAHQSGIVHRDLKPANIMLDRDGEPHVMDFGLAKRDASEVTMTADGRILGTPAYMSPEQARGAGNLADARSDTYSLGVILYELLTGVRPFQGEIRTLLLQIQHDEPTSPRRLNRHVPLDLEVICLKCLDKDPRQRYASALELAEDLERYLSHRPIKARPASTATRLTRWCQRNPLPSGLIATLLVSTAVAGLFAWIASLQSARASQQTTLATKNADLYKQEFEKSEKAAVQIQGLLETSETARTRAERSESSALRALDVADQNQYKNAILRANQLLAAGEIQVARALLDRCQPRLRKFEWYHLRQQCEDARFNERYDLGTQGTFTPDSRAFVATAYRDVVATDLNSGKELWRLPMHDQVITGRPAFTPDGKVLVTLCRGLPPSEDAETFPVAGIPRLNPGTETMGKIGGVIDAVNKLILNNKINLARVVSNDTQEAKDLQSKYLTLHFWDWRERKLLRRYAIEVEETLDNRAAEQSLQFSEDGKQFVFAGRFPRLIDTETGQVLDTFEIAIDNSDAQRRRRPEFFIFNHELNQVLLNGSLDLLTVSNVGFEVVDPRKNPYRNDTPRQQLASPGTTVVAFQGQILAVGRTSQNSIELWHARTGELIAEITTERPVISLAISLDQQSVAAVLEGGAIQIWSIATQKLVGEIFDADWGRSEDYSLQFSPDGQFLMSEDPFHVWSIQQQNSRQHLAHRAEGMLRDGQRYISVADGMIRTLTIASDAQQHAYTTGQLYRTKEHRNFIGSMQAIHRRSFDFSTRGHCAFVAETSPKRVEIYDASEGQLLAQLPDFNSEVEFVSIAQDRSRVAVRTADGQYSVWSYEPVDQLRFTSADATIRPGNMQLSRDGGRLIVFNQDRLYTLNIESGSVEARKHPGSEKGSTDKSYSYLSPNTLKYIYQPDIGNEPVLVDLERKTYQTLVGVNLRSNGVRFNDDETRLLIADKTIQVLDAESAELILEVRQPFEFRVNNESFWVSADDRTLGIYPAISETVGSVILTSGQFTNQFQLRLPTGQVRRDNDQNNALLELDFSVAGNRLVTTHSDGTTRLWDAELGRVLAEYPRTDRVKLSDNVISDHIELLDDGAQAISVGEDGTLYRWNMETGELIWSQTSKLQGRNLCLDARESLLATVADSGEVSLFQAGDGVHLWTVNEPREGKRYWETRFTPDGKYVATSSEDSIRFLNLRTGAVERTIDLSSINGEYVMDFAFSQDGKQLAVANQYRITRWNVATGELLGDCIPNKDLVLEILLGVQYDEQDRIVLHARSYGWALLTRFDKNTGHELVKDAITIGNANGIVGKYGLNQAMTRAAIGTRDGDVNLFDLREVSRSLPTIRVSNNAVEGRSDLSRLVTQSLDDVTWGIETRYPRGNINVLAFASDGRLIAPSSSGAIYLLDPATGNTSSILVGHRGEVTAVATSPRSPLLASAGEDGVIRIWNTDDNAQLYEFSPRVPLTPASREAFLSGKFVSANAVAMSPTEDLLAAGGSDGLVTFWEPSSGRYLGYLPKAPNELTAVHHLAFSPDGKTLAVSGRQLFFETWDVATRQLLRRFPLKHWSPPLCWSDDSKSLYAGDGPRIVAWDVTAQDELPRSQYDLPRYSRHLYTSALGNSVVACGVGDLFVLSADDLSLRKSLEKLTSLTCAAISADGETIFIAQKSKLTASNLESGESRWSHSYGTSRLLAADWSPDGEELAFAGLYTRIGRWKPFNSLEPELVPARSTRWIAYSPTGKQLAVCGPQVGVVLQDAATNEFSSALEDSEGRQFVSLAWSPDGGLLAGVDMDEALSIWQVNDGKQIARLTQVIDVPQHRRTALRVRWGRDSESIYVGGPDAAEVWVARDKESVEAPFQTQKHGERFAFNVASPSRRLNAGSLRSRLILNTVLHDPAIVPGVNPENKRSPNLLNYLLDEEEPLRAITWSPDESSIAAIDERQGHLAIAQFAGGSQSKGAVRVDRIDAPPVEQIAWWPGPLLAVLQRDNAIQLVDRLGRPCGSLLIFDERKWVFVNPNGHWFSDGTAEQELVYTTISADGKQAFYAVDEFSEKFAWENDAEKAKLRREDIELSKALPRSATAELRAQGKAAMQADAYDQATDLFRQAAIAAPGDMEIQVMLAHALFAGENRTEARDVIVKVLQQHPDYHSANLLLGEILLDSGEYEAAIVQYGHARSFNSGHEPTLRRLGDALFSNGDFDTMVSLHQSAIERGDATPLVRHHYAAGLYGQEKYAEAVEQITLAWEGDLKDFEIVDNALAIYDKFPEEKADRYRHIKQLYLAHLEKQPEDWEAYSALGFVAEQMQDMKTAVEMYAVAAAGIRDNAMLWNSHAWILATLDDDAIRDGKKALVSAQRAYELVKEDASVLDTLAACHAAIGEFDKAVEWQQKALALLKEDAQRAELEQHLESYKAGKALRQMPAEFKRGP